jgi:hypothetical protein
MIMSSKANNNKAPSSDSYLPRDFVPGEHDVVIGRSLKYYNHSGNVALRNIVASRLEEYTQAEKSGEYFHELRMLGLPATPSSQSSPLLYHFQRKASSSAK